LDVLLEKLDFDGLGIVVADKTATPYRINKELRAAEVIDVEQPGCAADNPENNARAASFFRAILPRRLPVRTRLRLGVRYPANQRETCGLGVEGALFGISDFIDLNAHGWVPAVF
jgi:hypothetical protein